MDTKEWLDEGILSFSLPDQLTDKDFSWWQTSCLGLSIKSSVYLVDWKKTIQALFTKYLVLQVMHIWANITWD